MGRESNLVGRIKSMGYSYRMVERVQFINHELTVGGKLTKDRCVYRLLTDGSIEGETNSDFSHPIKIIGGSFIVYYRVGEYPNGKRYKKLARIFITYSANEKKALSALDEYETIKE